MPKDNTPNQNLTVWEQLASVDRKFTKPITGKSYKGDSPNPTYVIRKLTEVFGPIGKHWGFTVQFDRVRYGKPHQVIKRQHLELTPPNQNGEQKTLSKTVEYELIREEYHEVCIRFWINGGGHFDAFGGTPMLYMTNSGKWMHDEDAAKKSLTDAYTKGASWLGACADIFLGLFDDKYSGAPDGGSGNKGQNQSQSPQQNGGWDGDPGWGDQPPQNQGAQQGSRQNTAPEDDGWN